MRSTFSTEGWDRVGNCLNSKLMMPENLASVIELVTNGPCYRRGLSMRRV